MRSFSTDMDPATAFQLMSALKNSNQEKVFVETLYGKAALGNSGASYYVLNRQGVYEQINTHLTPDQPIEEQAFDPHRLFDREGHDGFHHIYTVPLSALDGT